METQRKSKLNLDEKQIHAFARVLSELRIERAQAAVEARRMLAGVADAIDTEAFDQAAADRIAAERVKSAERRQQVLVTSLAQIHTLLRPDQRAKVSHLLRAAILRRRPGR